MLLYIRFSIAVIVELISLYNNQNFFTAPYHSVCEKEGLRIEAMVSLQPPLSPNPRKAIAEIQSLSKKRKLEEESKTEQVLEKRSKAESANSILDIGLHLETPLPLEWQRCLDIQVYITLPMILVLIQ